MLHIFRDFVDSSVPFQVLNSAFFSFYYLSSFTLLFRSSVSSLPQQQPPSRPAELRTRQRIYVNGSDNDSRPSSALSTSSGVSRTSAAHTTSLSSSILMRESWWDSRCLKISENVSLYIASEASYAYILNGQKFIKNGKIENSNETFFW